MKFENRETQIYYLDEIWINRITEGNHAGRRVTEWGLKGSCVKGGRLVMCHAGCAAGGARKL
jgi:hypothetical protein